MRRVFIIVLSGIISASTFSSILSTYFTIDTSKVLLDAEAGAIEAGNFSYWHIGHMGPLIIELISISGDADLYVADNIRPSYELDGNNFSSTSCGPDIVNIPTDFPRPLGIGVFGHWSHSFSEYSFQVYLDKRVAPHHEEPGHGLMDEYYYMDYSEKEMLSPQHDDGRSRFTKFLTVINVIFEKLLF